MDIRRIGTGIGCVVALGVGAAALAQSTGPAGRAPASNAPTKPATSSATSTSPATRPASPRELSGDQMLGQMLRPPPKPGGPKVLQPMTDPPAADRTSGAGAVMPGAPQVAVMREGTFLPERTGRLTRSPDGSQAEFTLDADGRALRDPPLVILPSLKLMAMENAVNSSNRDLKFRVSGTITEYRGRNYILLDKVFVMPDVQQQF